VKRAAQMVCLVFAHGGGVPPCGLCQLPDIRSDSEAC